MHRLAQHPSSIEQEITLASCFNFKVFINTIIAEIIHYFLLLDATHNFSPLSINTYYFLYYFGGIIGTCYTVLCVKMLQELTTFVCCHLIQLLSLFIYLCIDNIDKNSHNEMILLIANYWYLLYPILLFKLGLIREILLTPFALKPYAHSFKLLGNVFSVCFMIIIVQYYPKFSVWLHPISFSFNSRSFMYTLQSSNKLASSKKFFVSFLV